MRSMIGVLVGLFLVVGCATESPAVEEAGAVDGKADSASQLRVRTEQTTVWFDSWLAAATRDEANVIVLGGRASRDVIEGSGFIFDDVYGNWASRTKRTFEVNWHQSEAATIVQGTNQFVRLHFKPSRGRPDSLTAFVRVRPALKDFSGRGTYVESEITPYVVSGRTVFRLEGRVSSRSAQASNVRVEIGGQTFAVVPDTAADFHVDLSLDELLGSFFGDTSVRISIGTSVKRATLGLRVLEFDLTSEDPNEVWPPRQCEADVAACLAALPAGMQDFSSCGEAVDVLMCPTNRGVTFNDVAFVSAMALVDARMAVIREDLVGLVGDERAAVFEEAIHQTIEYRFEQMFGTNHDSQGALDAAVLSAIDEVVDRAYAYPLEFVEPVAPTAGDLNRTRDVAADGLLDYLANMDFLNTEFSRPYLEVVQLNRAWHVRSIRAFRETAVPASWSPNVAWDNFEGEWTNPHVEIRVSKTTGAVVDILFEID